MTPLVVIYGTETKLTGWDCKDGEKGNVDRGNIFMKWSSMVRGGEQLVQVPFIPSLLLPPLPAHHGYTDSLPCHPLSCSSFLQPENVGHIYRAHINGVYLLLSPLHEPFLLYVSPPLCGPFLVGEKNCTMEEGEDISISSFLYRLLRWVRDSTPSLMALGGRITCAVPGAIFCKSKTKEKMRLVFISFRLLLYYPSF